MPITPIDPQTTSPTAQTPPAKEVISPPPPGRGPMHKHTGFIIAIALTSLLLVGAAVMAYLSWDNGAKLENEIVTLQETARSYQAQNNELQTSLSEEMERPGPVPFYYTSTEERFISPTELHAVDPITGDDTIIFTAEGLYQIIAQPRVEWSSQIVLDRVLEGDNVGYVPFLFDVSQGEELVPAPVASVLPFDKRNISLSSDGLHALVIHDRSSDPIKRLMAINMVTGAETEVITLTGDLQFATNYATELTDTGETTILWESHDCARVYQWGPSAHEGEVTYVDAPRYCISDYVTE